METNIILAGVGGQGILSISVVIDMASLKQGLRFKQSEVHGMSQRGGAVSSHLRVSDEEVYSDLVPKGRGTLILSVEPLETLRYVEYLGPEGQVVSGVDPHVNLPEYPAMEEIFAELDRLPQVTLLHAGNLAREAGSSRAMNMVLLGAASPFLGIQQAVLEDSIRQAFLRKGKRIQEVNVEAFRIGQRAGASYRACLAAGLSGDAARALAARLPEGSLDAEALPLWRELFQGGLRTALMAALTAEGKERISPAAELPRTLLGESVTSDTRLREILFS
jgi:indolepyruvate ferredoxin oxidoreductase beta subunit